MNRLAAVLLACLAVAGCSGGQGDEAATASDTLTRGQRDTIISDLPVPGAGAVGRALDAAERAGERAERHDSIGG